MTEMKNVSVLLDEETLAKVTDLQKKTDTFSKSKMLRDLITKGLESDKK